MRQHGRFVFLAIFFLAMPPSAAEDVFLFKAETGYPFFDGQGRLNLVLGEQGGGLRLEIAPPGRKDFRLGFFPAAGEIISMKAKKDRTGRVWIIWEQRSIRNTDIFIGSIEEGELTRPLVLSREFEGVNSSPSLDVTFGQQGWAAWVNREERCSRLVVKNIGTEQSWVISLSADDSLFTPQVLADETGRVWVFWVEKKGGLDAIFFSVFEGAGWKRPEVLSSNPEFPHFHPTASLDFLGNPWVAWSSYDGTDYEIFISSWDGSRWLKPENVSQNNELADGRPSLAFLHRTIPAVAWTQAGKGEKNILLAFRDTNGWNRPVRVSDGAERHDSPVLITEGDRTAVLWNAGDRLCLRPLSFSEMLISTPVPAGAISGPTGSFRRDRNRFIAFGDSITYGWIAPPGDVKEKGYVPRLQTLLEGMFEGPYVFNEGVPGEPTWEAVSRLPAVIASNLALYLLLMEGTNDVTQEYYSMDTAAFNLREMIRKCRERDVFPLISTIIPRKGDRWTASARKRTVYLNDLIQKMAASMGAMLVDNFQSFFTYPPELGGWTSLIADPPDNLHPSEKGYQHMAETWFKRVRVIPFPPAKARALVMRREGHVLVTWEKDPRVSAEAGLTGYIVYRKTAEEASFFPAGTTPSSTYILQDRPGSLGRDYVYVLSAVNSEWVEGPLSDLVFTAPGDPFPPKNILAETVANKAFLHVEYINKVSWEANERNLGLFTIEKFRVYRKRKREDDGLFRLMGEVRFPQTTFLDRNLPGPPAAAEYVYGVSAVDTTGVEGAIGGGPAASGLSAFFPGKILKTRVK